MPRGMFGNGNVKIGNTLDTLLHSRSKLFVLYFCIIFLFSFSSLVLFSLYAIFIYEFKKLINEVQRLTEITEIKDTNISFK